MRKILTAVAILALTVVATFGQTNTSTKVALDGFMSGPISNVFTAAGATYSPGLKHHLGAEAAFGYNTPKAPNIFLQPYIVPLIGGEWIDGGLESFSGSAALKSDFHPLNFMSSTNTDFAARFTVSPFG